MMCGAKLCHYMWSDVECLKVIAKDFCASGLVPYMLICACVVILLLKFSVIKMMFNVLLCIEICEFNSDSLRAWGDLGRQCDKVIWATILYIAENASIISFLSSCVETLGARLSQIPLAQNAKGREEAKIFCVYLKHRHCQYYSTHLAALLRLARDVTLHSRQHAAEIVFSAIGEIIYKTWAEPAYLQMRMSAHCRNFPSAQRMQNLCVGFFYVILYIPFLKYAITLRHKFVTKPTTTHSNIYLMQPQLIVWRRGFAYSCLFD